MKKIKLPLDTKTILSLKKGEECLLSGIVYTARDAAHLRLVELIQKKQKLPFELKNQTIYYVGPTPAPSGKPIGSAGPTTSDRMDPFTPLLLSHGLKGMIGKGPRSKKVIAAIKKHKAVYFGATGGAGAFLASKIRKAEIIAFPDLGPEAIYKLTIEDFPVVVLNV